MKKLIYSIFAIAVVAMTCACEKDGSENDGPKLYVNTWMLDVSESSFMLLQLNDDGTAVLGQAYSSDALDDLRKSIDTENLHRNRKHFWTV